MHSSIDGLITENNLKLNVSTSVKKEKGKKEILLHMNFYCNCTSVKIFVVPSLNYFLW